MKKYKTIFTVLTIVFYVLALVLFVTGLMHYASPVSYYAHGPHFRAYSFSYSISIPTAAFAFSSSLLLSFALFFGTLGSVFLTGLLITLGLMKKDAVEKGKESDKKKKDEKKEAIDVEIVEEKDTRDEEKTE